MRNQVFQDDVRDGKCEEGKDIGDLHRCPINNFPAAESSSSPQARFAELDFQACFGKMACFFERKVAPFVSRPQPMKFKMTNAVIAADISRCVCTSNATSYPL